jgi:hypothetical protein
MVVMIVVSQKGDVGCFEISRQIHQFPGLAADKRQPPWAVVFMGVCHQLKIAYNHNDLPNGISKLCSGYVLLQKKKDIFVTQKLKIIEKLSNSKSITSRFLVKDDGPPT